MVARVPNSVRNIKTTIDEVTVAKSHSSGRHSHSDNGCLYRWSGCRTRSGDTRRDTSCRIFSRPMTKTERNYSTYDRELLAIVYAIGHFRHHLLGRRFVLRTDHRPLQYFPVTRDPWGRRARWLAELQPYDFSIQYVEGSQNCVADALSRLGFAKEPIDTIANVTSHDKSSQFLEDDIRTAQAADSDIAVVIRLLQSRRLPSADAFPSVKSFLRHDLYLAEDIVWRKAHDSRQLVVPLSLVP